MTLVVTRCRKLVSALEYRDRIAELEAKLEQTRHELTESYKKKGEHAQKLLDLNDLVQSKDEALAKKSAEYGLSFEGNAHERALCKLAVHPGQAARRRAAGGRAERHSGGSCQVHRRA